MNTLELRDSTAAALVTTHLLVDLPPRIQGRHKDCKLNQRWPQHSLRLSMDIFTPVMSGRYVYHMFDVRVRSAICRIQFRKYQCTCTTQSLYRHITGCIVQASLLSCYFTKRCGKTPVLSEIWRAQVSGSFIRKKDAATSLYRSGLGTNTNMDGTEDILQLVHKLCHLLTRPSLYVANSWQWHVAPCNNNLVFLECEIHSWTEHSYCERPRRDTTDLSSQLFGVLFANPLALFAVQTNVQIHWTALVFWKPNQWNKGHKLQLEYPCSGVSWWLKSIWNSSFPGSSGVSSWHINLLEKLHTNEKTPDVLHIKIFLLQYFVSQCGSTWQNQ